MRKWHLWAIFCDKICAENLLTLYNSIDRSEKTFSSKIDSLDDPDFLDSMNTMINNEDIVFQIPQEHLEGIKQGEEDIKNGDFLILEKLEKRYLCEFGWPMINQVSF